MYSPYRRSTELVASFFWIFSAPLTGWISTVFGRRKGNTIVGPRRFAGEPGRLPDSLFAQARNLLTDCGTAPAEAERLIAAAEKEKEKE